MRGRGLVVALLACGLAAWAVLVLTVNPLTASLFGSDEATVPMADFGSFYASGQAARDGLNPYGVYPLTLDAALGLGGGAAVNLNPPISVVVFEVLSSIADPVAARRGWFLATLVAYAVLVGLLMRACPRFRGPLVIACALAFTPFVETLLLGQVYVFLALVAALAWLMLQHGRSGTAGVLIGFVVAFKPMFVIWPLLLLVGGHRRAGGVSLVAALGFGLLPLAQFGPSIYAQWLEVVHAEAVNTQVANASLAALLARFGIPTTLAIAIGGLLILGAGVFTWKQRPSINRTNNVALLVALIGSPLAWVGYGVFLLPVFASNWGTALVVAAAVLLCVPRLVLQGWADASPALNATIGSAYAVAWLLLLAHQWRRGEKR